MNETFVRAFKDFILKCIDEADPETSVYKGVDKWLEACPEKFRLALVSLFLRSPERMKEMLCENFLYDCKWYFIMRKAVHDIKNCRTPKLPAAKATAKPSNPRTLEPSNPKRRRT